MIRLALILLVVLFGLPRGSWASEVSVSTLMQAGISAFSQGDFRGAETAFSQVLQQDPDNFAAYQNRCLTRIELQQYAFALEDCSAALHQNPNDSEAYLNRGVAYYRSGRYNKAIADFTQVLHIAPQDYRAHYNRGLVYSSQGHYTQALLDYETAREQVPLEQPSALAMINNDAGIAHIMLNQYPAAIVLLTQVLQENPTDTRTLYNRGCAYHHQGKLTEAIADFTTLIQLEPSNAQAYLSRGLMYQQLQQVEAAIADWQWAAQSFYQQNLIAEYQQTLNWIQQLQTPITSLG